MGNSNHLQQYSSQKAKAKTSSSKKPASASSATSSRTPQKRIPAEVITYRLGSEMVYVDPAGSMEEALDYAQSVFPTLLDIPRSQIAFCVNVRVNSNLRTVRIAPMAWKRVMASLTTYEIIDINILPPTLTSKSDSAFEELAPPKYIADASTSSPSLLGADLYSSGVFLGCEKSPLVIRSSSGAARPQARGFFDRLLRRS